MPFAAFDVDSPSISTLNPNNGVSNSPMFVRSIQEIIAERSGNQQSQTIPMMEAKEFSLEIQQKLNEKYTVGSLIDGIKDIKLRIVNLFALREEAYDKYSNAILKFERVEKTMKEAHNALEFYGDSEFQNQINKKIEEYRSTLHIDQLKDTFDECNQEYSYIKEILNTMGSSNKSATCGICMDRQVDLYADVCGHTICEECNKNMTSNKCHVCRSKVSKYKKLYYSC